MCIPRLKTRCGKGREFARTLPICCLALLRKRGLPARYVSGYLVAKRAENPSFAIEEVIGGHASHAWAEVYIPQCGWKALDPTLGASVGARHVRIAYGRDYGDVAPVRGLYNGHAGQRLTVDVQLRPGVDIDGYEQMNGSAAYPDEEDVVDERPSQPLQQQQQQQQ